jgi:LPS export ABC transporter protein LptC
MRPRVELVLAVLVAACGPTAQPAATPPPSSMPTVPNSPVPVHVTSSGNGRETVLTEMKDRRTIYVVRAASFEADTTSGASATGSGTFAQPRITFIDRDGERTQAAAPKAVLTGDDKSVLMVGGVQARSQDGNVLHCDQLRYDGQTERIHGEGHVEVTTPSGLVLTGDLIDGDSQLKDVKVTRR